MKHPISSPSPCRLSQLAHRSRALLAVSAAVFTIAPASAQIAAWDFFGENQLATSTAEVYDSHLDSANSLTRGAGAAASAGGNSFRTQGFSNNGIATTNTDYFQTTFSAAAGYTLSLSSIDARFNGTNTFFATPGVTAQFAYSLDGTSFTLIGSPFSMTSATAMPQINVAGVTALQNVSDTVTVTIRYYASGQTTGGGWGFSSAATAGTIGLAFGGTLTPAGGGDTTPPALTSTSPTTGTTGALTTTHLALTYNESLVAASGTIAIKKFSDNSTVEAITFPSAKVTISGATATINPATVLDYTTQYYLEITSGTFTDASLNPVAAITGNSTLNFTTRAAAPLVINQYYEGASSSRFIELRNLTGSPITMNGYRLAAWSASDSPSNQAWKSGTNTTPRVTALDGLTIPANGYYLICDPAATFPGYAVANRDLAPAFPSGVAFSGTASVVLYSSAMNDQNSIADAISIAATEGTDTSFYRLDNLPGFDFTTGTSITNYSSTWGTKTVPQVDSALVSEEWYLQASQAPKVLTLGITPSTFFEGAGAGAATATVTRSGLTAGDLVVTITVSDISEASAAASVTILDGQTSATFPINAVNDLYLDGDIQVNITVSATNHTPAVKPITVTDELTDIPFPVVINEVDSDQVLTDTGEFVELYNNSSSPVSLDGVVLIFYNGASNTSYRFTDLTGKTIPANGYFVVGNPGVANVGITFPNEIMQNGEDAVALYLGQVTAFPNGTAVTTTAGKLVDAVVYGTGDPDATALIAALTPGKPQVNEGTGAASETVSISRLPNGGAAFDSTLYITQAPSPGLTNILPPPNNYANWINGFFPGVTDPLIIGFNADPDGDGVRNGVEALSGGNPNAAGVFATSELTKVGNVFSFLYPKAKSVPVGVTAAYEWSTDLVNWRASGGTFGGVTVTLAEVLWDDTTPSVDIYQVNATVTVGTAATLFVRVVAKN